MLVCLAGGCGFSDGDVGMPAPAFSRGEAPPRRPPDHTVGGFGVALPALTLMPGEERFPCYVFPIDLAGPSRVIGGASLAVGPGMHHGNLTSRPATGTGIRACTPDDAAGGSDTDIARGGQVLFASSTQVTGEEWQTFPTGMGYR